MKFLVKNNSIYKELVIKGGNVTLESGLLTEQELRALSDDLQDVIDDLLQGLEPKETK
jgi:hypothetical protein